MFLALQEISFPMLRSQPAFHGVYLLRNRADPEEISYLTLWADAIAVDRAIRSVRWQQALRRFAVRSFQLGEPRIGHHDVIAEEHPA